MEILFISHKYPPSIGGMEMQSFHLINGMKRHATVHAIIYEGSESKLSFFHSLQKRILKACMQFPGISVIHFNDGLIAAFCLMHKGYGHLLRTVTLHGLDVVYPNAFYSKYILPRFNSFALIFTVSRATAKACIELGILPEKIVVVNNGVDTAIAGKQDSGCGAALLLKKYGINIKEKTVLVMMGRPVKRKGFSWFIKNVVPSLAGNCIVLMIGPFPQRRPISGALLMALPRFLQTQLTLLLGFPTDEENIRALLSEHALSHKVKHLGKLPFQQIIQILRAADAFVMPNIRVEGDMEGFGLVCLEAALCGTPVFASRLEGIEDAIIEGKNGFLLPSGDVAAWTLALNTLIDNPQCFKQQLATFQSYTLHYYSREKMVQEYSNHFAKICGKPACGVISARINVNILPE